MTTFSPLASGLVLFLTVGLVPAAEPERPAPERPAPRRPIGGAPVLLLKVDERSITVKTAPTDKTAAEELKLAVDAKRTKVTVGEVVEQKDQGGGRVVMRTKTRPGTLADLKAGQRVRVVMEGDLATGVEVVPVPQAPQRRKEPDAGRKAE
jgi:hypothetical protein